MKKRALFGLFPLLLFVACASESVPMMFGASDANIEIDKDDIIQRIIYEGSISLQTTDLAKSETDVRAIVAALGGKVAAHRRSGQSGAHRTSTWTLRVPSERYGDALEKLSVIGEVLDVSTTSREVTAEYVDVEAQIRNKQAEEKRLLELLATRVGKLKDVLAIEKELSRVRGEVEGLQGRMRVLNDQTQLATIRATVFEIEEFLPAGTPGFLITIQRTFAGSASGLVAAIKLIVLGLVALVPWVLALAPFVIAFLWWRRRRSLTQVPRT